MQNRVTPTGEIIDSNSRGTWMGNRGVLHKSKKILRPFKLLNWVTCVLQYHGIRRNIMSEGRYTELFFLDEATAFSAGHRPCAECRRADYTRFKSLWIAANKDHVDLPATAMKYIDRINHEERITAAGEKKTYQALLSELPGGVMIQLPGAEDCYLYFNNRLLKWTPFGYSGQIGLQKDTMVTVLTPKSFVRTFKKGYVPGIHVSANSFLNHSGHRT